MIALPCPKEHFPRWLRVWHWINAVLFITLAATGFSLHFASPEGALIPFNAARVTHNVCGMALTANYLYFLVMNLARGNWVHYLPRLNGLVQRLWVQSMFYAVGIFRGEHHPYPPQPRCKYNPLQQLAYLGVMAGGMPLLIGSGLVYYFPELLPERILGWGGVWPVAVLHTLMGFLLTAFLIAHLYLATVGKTLTADLKKMLFGDGEVQNCEE